MRWSLIKEWSRVRAVKRIGAETGVAEPDFDRFVQQAADAFAAPIALLTLIESDTLWIKAATGFEVECAARKDSFCTHAIDRGEPLEVCDASINPQFRNLPGVMGDPLARYYIGAPLTLMDGTDVGALCVIDTTAREPASRDQRAYLVALARQAARALERRAHVRNEAAA
ncbi:MAG: GAF domain-containing protein [Sphingomonas sp.]|uniref:GAF domain-containing protein n=1 Tax=Sphingomonas adhaesiva TaxID=28212 RepID=A0A2A4IBJ6_9SPHN|nr:GAF domain-containing protein [Sphingomonas adhaesiva]PZU77495.1 MAG: GAF domain-containing protein [Sphingomonas sp.]